jgi:hypothetical protein
LATIWGIFVPMGKALLHILVVVAIIPLVYYLWRRWIPADSRFASSIPLECPACGQSLPKFLSRGQHRAIQRNGWTCLGCGRQVVPAGNRG